MIVDFIRASYSPQMIFFSGGIPENVFWYRAAPEAEVFPSETVFSSLDEAEEIPTEDLGEVRPPRGDWRNGQRPALYNGKKGFRGTIEAFQEGQGVIDLDPVQVTCANEPVTIAVSEGPFQFPLDDPGTDDIGFIGQLGVRWNQKAGQPAQCHVCDSCADFPADPLCDCCIPASLLVKFTPVSNASLWSGFTCLVNRDQVDDCLWEGIATAPYDSSKTLFFSFLNALDATAIPWVIEWGESPSLENFGQQGQDGAACDPFSVLFSSVFVGFPSPTSTCRIEVVEA